MRGIEKVTGTRTKSMTTLHLFSEDRETLRKEQKARHLATIAGTVQAVLLEYFVLKLRRPVKAPGPTSVGKVVAIAARRCLICRKWFDLTHLTVVDTGDVKPEYVCSLCKTHLGEGVRGG